MPATRETTRLVQALHMGDEQALGQLVDLLYNELHRAAHRYMLQEQPGHTLQTTALIHEVYLRLVDIRAMRVQDRAHFLALCARMMRRVLIDLARARKGKKRGASQIHLSLDQAPDASIESGSDLLAIDQALNQLAGWTRGRPRSWS